MSIKVEEAFFVINRKVLLFISGIYVTQRLLQIFKYQLMTLDSVI